MNDLTLLFESFSLGSEMMLILLPWILLLYSIFSSLGFKKQFLIVSGLAFLYTLSSFSWVAILIIIFISLINFLLLFSYQKNRSQILILFGFCINLSALIILKYIPDTTVKINDFSHFTGIIGISFYVFHVWSVFMDIHTKKITEPIRLLSFLSYLLYFPKIITGPLVRYNDFEKELDHNSFNETMMMQGIGLLLIGIIKKAIADFLSQYPTTIYSNPEGYSGFEHLFAMYGYALYIFLDFSAYTDMARGISRVFGIELPENFNSPYRSTSIIEFWRRWHITLSLWIRDYIYIPLGGSRHGTIRTNFNLFIAFFLSGLWHGVGLNFALWGVLHGTGIIINKLFSSKYSLPLILGWFITFHWVSIGWIFFANPIDTGMHSLSKIFIDFDLSKVFGIMTNNLLWYCVLIASFIYAFWDHKIVMGWSNLFERQYFPIKATLFWAIIWFTLIIHQGRVNTFIYQNF